MLAHEGKGHVGRFTEYTPLAMSRENILVEIVVVDLKEAEIKPPKALLQEKKGTDKTK
jgi:hypothetical protein